MKFSHQFRDQLTKDGYPVEWVNSAISYSQLKKCIKRVQRELASLGLDVETLRKVLSLTSSQDDEQELKQTPTNSTTSDTGELIMEDEGSRRESTSTTDSIISHSSKDQHQKPFQYTFLRGDKSPSRRIIPKLLFVVDAETGEPLSAGLAPKTRNYLHQLAVAEELTNIRITSASEDDLSTSLRNYSLPSEDADRPLRFIQIPLTTDSEFFRVLEKELTDLNSLKEAERKKLGEDIHNLAGALGKATRLDSKASRKDLERWRQLFECYIDARVFFATNERDHGIRSSEEAAKNFATFLQNAEKARLLEGYKQKESVRALQSFLTINKELLQSLRFQEINHMAMRKILKKFDKQTALGATSNFSSAVPDPLLSEDFSRALASQVATEIVPIVPQLDDYLCPICFGLAYRPVRLRCGHLFCIRCMVKLQREKRDKCALCRQPVVMEADSSNLDGSLVHFLERYFPEEVKAKQKAAGKEMVKEVYGEEICCVM